jgi:hypothetical protein
MHALKTLAFAYDSLEDRILSIVNLEHPQPWTCWLTRRLTLATLHETAKFMERTSALVQRAAAEFRAEITAFERDAAMSSTAHAVKILPRSGVKAAATTARADRLTIACQADKFRFELQDNNGEGVAGLMERAELQRILRMLEDETHKAGWIVKSGGRAETPEIKEDAAPGLVRH